MRFRLPKCFLLTVFAALIALYALDEAGAAEFKALQVNPVRHDCLFSNYISSNAYRHWLDIACTPGAADARQPGEGTPRKLRDLAREGTWAFTREGRPELGLDGALTFDDTHGRAVFRSLNFGRVIRVTGEIRDGDTDRLRAFLTRNDLLHCYSPGYCPYQNVLSLDSAGGNLAEALKMAQFVRDHQFNTLLEPNATCASACSFIFLAGYTNYEGFYHSRRFAHETSRLGVHRPSLKLEDRAYSAPEVKAFFEIFDYVKSEAVRQFVSARFPMRTLGKMYDTAPEDMFYVPAPQMSLFATLFTTPLVSPTRLPRVGLLSLCAEEYAKSRGHVHDDLLRNLASNDETFLTFVENDPFLCYGARTADNRWIYDICSDEADQYCLLTACLYDREGPCVAADPDRTFGFLEDAGNGSLGYALANTSLNMKRMVQLSLLGKRAANTGDRLRQAGRWIARAAPPPEYCGQIDFRARENAALLQHLLNEAGYDAGPVDGKPGGKTMRAVRAANIALLQPDAAEEWQITRALLRAIGATDAQIRAMEYCA